MSRKPKCLSGNGFNGSQSNKRCVICGNSGNDKNGKPCYVCCGTKEKHSELFQRLNKALRTQLKEQ